jgi:hypothetical protein
MMDELLLELAKTVPVVGVLLLWVRLERSERIADKSHSREESEKHTRIVLRLIDKNMPDE